MFSQTFGEHNPRVDYIDSTYLVLEAEAPGSHLQGDAGVILDLQYFGPHIHFANGSPTPRDSNDNPLKTKQKRKNKGSDNFFK